MKQGIEYRSITQQEMKCELFSTFVRHQVVDKCRRKIDGQWTIVSDPFVDDWGEEQYKVLVACLRNTIEKKGVVYGAFSQGKLKGFCSVESEFLGSNKQYMDLTSIHVSEDARGRGIGKRLFILAVDWARTHSARKLYISAHSAVESQAFYQNMGCVEAEEYNAHHVEQEPCDCQLEYVIGAGFLRTATADDYDVVEVLMKQVQQLHEEWRPDIYKSTPQVLPYEEFEEAQEKNQVVVAERDGVVIGVLMYLVRHVENDKMVTRDVLFIDVMAVLDKYRGYGIGHQFFDYMKTLYQEGNYDGLELQVNARNLPAREMYKNYGFTEKSINMELL